jgi:hypothetical protein
VAGTPVKRERRERAEAERAAGRVRPRAKTVDPATRAAAVTRAEQIGTAAAAEEFGVQQATIRSWRRRSRSEPVSDAQASGVSGAMAVPLPVAGGGDIEEMRATAALARRLSAEAAEQSVIAMRAGRSAAVRELAAAGKLWSATSASLAQAIAVAEASSRRLAEGDARLLVAVVEGYHAAIGVPLTPTGRKVLRYLIEHAGDAELSAGPDAKWAAREVRTYFRQAIEVELAAETARQARERDAPADGDEPEPDEPHGEVPEPALADAEEVTDAEVVEEQGESEADGEPAPGDDELPSWDELPEEWKAGRSTQRDLARYEFQQAQRREEIERRTPGPRGTVGRFGAARFSHPGLGGGR